MVAEHKRLEQDYAKLLLETERLKSALKTKTTCTLVPPKASSQFSYHRLKKEQFQYYTGFSYERFNNLAKFIIPCDTPLRYSKNMTCLTYMSNYDQLLFVLMKLRQNFDFKHLSNLFNILQQDASVLFNDWINFMFYRLGSLCIWPDRDTIIENMPSEYRKDFPNSVVIIDGTEIKIQRPSSLKSQSQCYSDYKSCTTLKGLIGVDPRGSVIFSSMLFSGSISDKEMTLKSGFYDLLKNLLDTGKLKSGDGIMADKGFTIEKEIGDLGLKLNIPPFAPSSGQMKASDVTKTIKIAKHRVHVERAIARIKQFKILANKISLGFFKCIDQIWLVCCLLTNFMPYLISKEN